MDEWLHPGLPDHPRREVDHQVGVRGARLRHRPPQVHLESSISALTPSCLITEPMSSHLFEVLVQSLLVHSLVQSQAVSIITFINQTFLACSLSDVLLWKSCPLIRSHSGLSHTYVLAFALCVISGNAGSPLAPISLPPRATNPLRSAVC